jgi:16S rRNA (cytidine1402-2'-O)-methyltransferase
MCGKLYVVGTPIGNLGDLSPRAVETLNSVDFIAAEDTRVTLKLLNHFDIKKPLVSYYEHNKRYSGQHIVDRIISGENCAVVTDAGMPCISDPGIDLVSSCRERGVEIYSVPGPSAVVTAAAMSGFDVTRFTFEGFLSVNKPSRIEHLEDVSDEKRTMIFYEAPHKLLKTLEDMRKYFGNRKIAVIKELTKIHENVWVTDFDSAIKKYSSQSPKGEFVLVIEGKKEAAKKYSMDDAVLAAKKYLSSGYSMSEAAKLASRDTGIKKNDIYSKLISD